MPASAWCVYILRCGDGSLYTGATNDLERRVAHHGAGKGARYTRSRLPVAVVYREAAATRGAALRREAAVKQLTRKQKLALIDLAPAAPLAPTPRASRGRTPPPPRARPGRPRRSRPMSRRRSRARSRRSR